MRHAVRLALMFALSVVGTPPVHADSNPAIKALQETPVSLFTYGLNALEDSINTYVGRGGTPSPSAIFHAPLDGRIADFATVLYDSRQDTVTINLIRIQKLPPGTSPDDACNQGIAALRLFAGIDPRSGQLQGGMSQSLLTDSFTAPGTPVTAKPIDGAALDKTFRFRIALQIGDKRLTCTAPLFGTDATYKDVTNP